MDGHAFTYDKIGNPTSYYNGYDYNFTWEHGRQLKSAATGGATTYYQYNADGIRTQKQTGDLVTEYFLVDGKAIGEVVRDPWGYYFYWLRYTFDENGQIIGFGCWVLGDTAWTEYYFAKNLQGDVISVYRVSDNEQVAEYQYDAWGNIIYKSGDMADINPFRYRTYYYDNETWFYYLQSRYYDPAIGRFINADVLISTGQGLLGNNMFAYCNNNPVMGYDPCGTCIHNWKFYNCEKCSVFWNGVGEWFLDVYNTMSGVNQQQAQLQTQIIIQQNDMLADAAGVIWDTYTQSCNQQQEAQLSHAQLMLDGVMIGYNLLDETEVIDTGMAGYHTYKAASSFKKAVTYFCTPIPTAIDEGFAVGYMLKGLYHFSKVIWEAIK